MRGTAREVLLDLDRNGFKIQNYTDPKRFASEGFQGTLVDFCNDSIPAGAKRLEKIYILDGEDIVFTISGTR